MIDLLWIMAGSNLFIPIICIGLVSVYLEARRIRIARFRVALALGWIGYAIWVCYLTRPVVWPGIEILPAEAHVGAMSGVYGDKMQQLQAVLDSGAPVVSGKGWEIPVGGGVIWFRPKALPQRIYDLHILSDGPGPAVIITGKE